MFDGRFRANVDRRVSPLGAALRRTRLTPDQLTALGLVMAVPTAILIGSGRLFVGLVLLIASAVPDLLDGALAKASGTASVRGAFFDSVSDRVTDALILGGFAWYLQSRYHGHAAMLPFAILAASMLVSYERAKAESLGFAAKGGLMERAERIVVLCIGLAFSAVLVPLLWVMLALTSLTAVQRFVKVWRQASRVASPSVPRGTGAPSAAATGSAGRDASYDAAHRDTADFDTAALDTAAHRDTADFDTADRDTGDRDAAGVPTGPSPRRNPVDHPVAMADRWRAWLQAGGPGSSPLSHRFADGTRRRTGERWQERRRAWRRAAQAGEGPGEGPGPRRRPGNRRP